MSTPTAPGASATTALFGLLGHPVEHSLSPAMHNAAFEAVGADARYLAFDVVPGDLSTALDGARALGVRGLNATVPHKQAALALAQEADPLAVQAGAANTLCPTAKGWKAYNTDVEGLLRALEVDLGFTPTGQSCVILGAGGAARAAVVGLAARGAQEIRVTNRNGKRAEALVRELAPMVKADALRTASWEHALTDMGPGSLLVSATPLGLSAQGRWPWDPTAMPEGLLVFDMAYRRGGETPLVDQARGAGLTAASGRSMLLHQGALAFELWTGIAPPLAVMGAALDRN